MHIHLSFSGEEEYNCVWFESRGPNIMEFQMGLRPSTTPSFELCDNSHFLQRTWNTQAREFSYDIHITYVNQPIGRQIAIVSIRFESILKWGEFSVPSTISIYLYVSYYIQFDLCFFTASYINNIFLL